MPLPQQVVEKLSREPIKTPGWSGGILIYAGALLGIVIALYIALAFVYAPILRARISSTQDQITALNKSISATDEQKLAVYYSQVTNLRSIIQKHVFFSPFLSWLETHTETGVSFGTLNYTTGNQVTFSGTALKQTDVNQQVAVFQSAPEVQTVSISNLSFSPIDNTWQFNVSLVMQPSIFGWPSSAAVPTQ